MFRRRFSTAGMNVCQARLKITSDLYHLAYVNGRLVHRGPGRSYPFAKAYHVIDLTSWLNPGGDQVIAVLSLEQAPVPGGESVTAGRGLLAELDLVLADGSTRTVAGDRRWRCRRHQAFTPDTPHSCIMPGLDECFDARLEETGWTLPAHDDAGWETARELGPVGTPPWTGMLQNTAGLPSEDPVFPVRFAAIEVARPRDGYHFRLGPAAEGLMIYATAVTAAAPATVRLWNVQKAALDGRPVVGDDLAIPAGTHLLVLCRLAYGSSEPEFFFETTAALTFSAAGLPGGHAAQWVCRCLPAKTVKYPWHETAADVLASTPEIPRLLAVPDLAALAARDGAGFTAAVPMAPSTLHLAMTRRYGKVAGGFTERMIERGQPREDGGDACRRPLIGEHNLLHANAEACTVLPQPGRDVHVIVDFDRIVIGYVRLELEAPAGTVVEGTCFEMIDGGGISWMSSYNSFGYTCREGRQTFLSHFRRGFRYLSLTLRNFTRPLQLRTLCCHHAAHPVQRLGGFACSDPLLNDIYRLSADTAALCMLDTYVDCVGHEQAFWTGDAYVTALINLLTCGAYGLDQHHLRLVGQSLRPEWEQLYWPHDGRQAGGHRLPIAAFPNYPEGGLPMWSFLWMLHCWEHYWHGADRGDLEENFGYLEETLRRCRRLTNDRGLFDQPGAWNLVEWGNNDLSPYGEVTANNVLLVRATRLTARMARALGRHAQADTYEQEAQARQDAVNRHCWDDTRRAYVDTVRDRWAYDRYLAFWASQGTAPMAFDTYLGCTRVSEQSNTLALLCDCVPPDRQEAVTAIVLRIRDGHHVPGGPFARTPGPPPETEAPGGIVAVGSPFFLFFSLGALFKLGRADDALKVIRDAWGPMIASDSRGCWETFKQDERHWTRSISHAWSAAPAIYLPSEVLGIKPVAPGYKKFTVTPRTAGLEWARGAVATPSGPIQVHWRRHAGGRLEIDCSAPPDCERVEPSPETP